MLRFSWSGGHCRICIAALGREDFVEYTSLRSVGRTLLDTPHCAQSGGHCRISLAGRSQEDIVDYTRCARSDEIVGYASLHSVGRTL